MTFRNLFVLAAMVFISCSSVFAQKNNIRIREYLPVEVIQNLKLSIVPRLLKYGIHEDKVIVAPIYSVTPYLINLNSKVSENLNLSVQPVAVMGIAENNKYYFVCHKTGTLLSVFSKKSGSLIKTISFDDENVRACSTVAADPANSNAVYVSSISSRELFKVDFSTEIISDIVNVSGPKTIIPVGNFIFSDTANLAGSVGAPLIYSKKPFKVYYGTLVGKYEKLYFPKEFTHRINNDIANSLVHYINPTAKMMVSFNSKDPIDHQRYALKINNPTSALSTKNCVAVFGSFDNNIEVEFINVTQRPYGKITIKQYEKTGHIYETLLMKNNSLIAANREGIYRIKDFFPKECMEK